VLCETGLRLEMDGQARSMDARKAGRIGGWTRIRDGIRRRKKGLTSRMKPVFGGKRGACRIVSCWFFFLLLRQ
jgi:hypothetical protein